MRTRRGSFPGKRYLPLAALLGAAVAVLPGLASGSSPSTVSFTASDYEWKVSGSSATMVTIAVGGTVEFSYPSGASAHNADFGTGAQPSSCIQTEGPSSGAVPPLPHSPTAPAWRGTCTFNAAGTYVFHCDLHPNMTGMITVGEPSGTTGTTTTTTTTPSPTTTTTATPPPPSGSPLAGPVSKALKLAKSQRGGSVKGSLNISQAGAGDRLEIDVFAKSASLAKAKHTARVRVGRLIRSSVSAGRLSFSVKLDAKARRALKRHRRLALTVQITLTPLHGEPLTVNRAIVERA